MAMFAPMVSKAPARISESPTRKLAPQRAAVAPAKGVPWDFSRIAVSAPGQRLPAGVRTAFETRLGADFSDVRVHTDARAARSARDLGARAYTVGSDIVFGSGHYRPGTSGTTRLLAHELAHVVQQSRGGTGPAETPALERSAEAAADRVVAGRSASVMGAAAPGVAREGGGAGLAGLDATGKYAHPVTFKTMDEYAASGAVNGVQAEDGTWHAVIYRSYPPASMVPAAPVPPRPKPVHRPKPVKAPDPPVSAARLRDIAEGLQPRLIYPKPVRQLAGAVQFLGGGLEAGFGGVGGLATAETGVGLAAGGFLLLHGADQASSGWTKMWTGEDSPTYVFRLGAGTAAQFTDDKKMQAAIGSSVDLTANLAAGAVGLGMAARPMTLGPVPDVPAAGLTGTGEAAAAKSGTFLQPPPTRLPTPAVRSIFAQQAGVQATGESFAGRIAAGVGENPQLEAILAQPEIDPALKSAAQTVNKALNDPGRWKSLVTDVAYDQHHLAAGRGRFVGLDGAVQPGSAEGTWSAALREYSAGRGSGVAELGADGTVKMPDGTTAQGPATMDDTTRFVKQFVSPTARKFVDLQFPAQPGPGTTASTFDALGGPELAIHSQVTHLAQLQIAEDALREAGGMQLEPFLQAMRTHPKVWLNLFDYNPSTLQVAETGAWVAPSTRTPEWLQGVFKLQFGAGWH